MPRPKSEAEVTAEADAKWWNEEWLKFPTVSLDDAGNVATPQLRFEIRKGMRSVDPVRLIGRQRAAVSQPG